MTIKNVPGAASVFIFRNVNQNSLQSTVTRDPKEKPLLIPRSGTSAPIGAPTLKTKPLTPDK